jgi:hypothetical protein
VLSVDVLQIPRLSLPEFPIVFLVGLDRTNEKVATTWATLKTTYNDSILFEESDWLSVRVVRMRTPWEISAMMDAVKQEKFTLPPSRIRALRNETLFEQQTELIAKYGQTID